MNWCGPYWSDGQFQTSRRGHSPALNDFDETCREHDFTYADKGDLRSADLLFASKNIGRGFIRTGAGLAVGLQGLFRSVDKRIPTKIQIQEEMIKQNNKTNLRGESKPRTIPTRKVDMNIRRAGAPVAIGSIIRQQKPKLIRQKDGASLHGTDFLGTVEGLGVADFGIGKAALLSPAYFVGTFLGNLARSFEKYKWKELIIHYVPKVSTSTGGQVILTSSKSVSEPVLNPNSGTFLQRAMSQGNATMGPLWMENYIEIACDDEWRLVDPATTADPDDAIAEELQVFSQTTVSGQVGYLYAEYIIEFQNTIFTPHSTSIPIYTGPGLRIFLSDSSGINAIGDDVVFVDPLNYLSLSSVANGTIFRMVFDAAGSTAPGGATLANYLSVAIAYKTNTVTSTSSLSNLALSGGTVLYGVIVGTLIYMYSSLEGAISGNGTAQLFVRSATLTSGSYAFDAAMIRHGTVVLAATQ